MTCRYMLFFCLIIGIVFMIYRYDQTSKIKFLFIGWGLVVINLVSLLTQNNGTFIASFISNMGIGLIIYVTPIGIYYLRKFCKPTEEESIEEYTRSAIIALACFIILLLMIPGYQYFEKAACAVSSEYNDRKIKEKSAEEISSLKFDREWSFKMEAQMAILHCLKAPETAKFDLYEEYYRNPDTNEWMYVGIVSSQNSFGAFLTKKYYAYFSSDGKYLIGIKFEDEIIPFNKKVHDWEKWGPKLNSIEEKQ